MQANLDTTEILKKVRAIELKTRGITNNIFAGEYHSAFKGRGMSFSEVREYQYGDDIRNIDWNVTARYKKPFIKTFEEERELTLMLLIDVSKSSYFGTKTQFKSELITEMCAVLAFSAIKNNDKVGLILFSDTIELFIPPKKGKYHILRIIRELINFKPTSHGTNLAEGLKFFTNVIKKRSIAFVMSDFMCDNFSEALSVACKKHDLTGIHVYDEAEKELPKVGLARLLDAETGSVRWVNTASKKVRDHFSDTFISNQKEIKSQFVKNRSDLLSIKVEDSYIKTLRQFFKRRELKR
ncbi:MAG: DUF58 domain-containing protein [Bacteroidia bacterium]